MPCQQSQELNRFLLQCFEKSPLHRPGAAVLLEDPWIQGNKRRFWPRFVWGVLACRSFDSFVNSCKEHQGTKNAKKMNAYIVYTIIYQEIFSLLFFMVKILVERQERLRLVGFSNDFPKVDSAIWE